MSGGALAVHGVDLNPFAVAIARFSALLAALKKCHIPRLQHARSMRRTSARPNCDIVHDPSPNPVVPTVRSSSPAISRTVDYRR
jgi:hypothetical protein